jgi:hypothetical protein
VYFVNGQTDRTLHVFGCQRLPPLDTQLFCLTLKMPPLPPPPYSPSAQMVHPAKVEHVPRDPLDPLPFPEASRDVRTGGRGVRLVRPFLACATLHDGFETRPGKRERKHYVIFSAFITVLGVCLHVRFFLRIPIRFGVRFAAKGVPQVNF